MVATKARAKAEAALARVSFSKKEIEIQTEMTHLETYLDALEREREREAEAAVANLESEIEHCTQFLHAQSTQQRTAEYVNAHIASSGGMQPPRDRSLNTIFMSCIEYPTFSAQQGLENKKTNTTGTSKDLVIQSVLLVTMVTIPQRTW